ncbi:MAG: SPOR domain-containing protein [Desulfuromonadaceae bacterium]|nr:SPOR domain-containing protein [Desulfuromonadaceae bacterium]
MFTVIKIKIIPVFLLSFLVAFFSPCVSAEDNSQLEKGKFYFQSGQYYFATTWLERFIRSYPTSVHRKEALIMISRAYALSDRDEKSARYQEILAREFPDSARPVYDKDLNLKSNEMSSRPSTNNTATEHKQKRPSLTRTVPEIKSDAGNSRSEKQQLVTSGTTQETTRHEKTLSGRVPPVPVGQAEGVSLFRRDKAPITVIIPDKISAPALVGAPSPSLKQRAFKDESLSARVSPNPSSQVEVRVTQENCVAYTVLVDRSVRRQKLKKNMERLKAEGFQPVIQKTIKSMTVYRLVAESFSAEPAAKKYLSEISSRVKQAFVIKNNKQYRVVAASFFSFDDAYTGQKILAKKALQTEIVKSTVNMRIWSITVGSYNDSQQAEIALKSLAEKGINAVVIPRGI